MRLTITIDADNAAFAGDAGREVARMLHVLADRADVYGTDLPHLDGMSLHDANGNTVGHVRVTDAG